MDKCKYCNSKIIIKKGIDKKYQKHRYYCKECKRYFSSGNDNRIKRDNKERELCLLLYNHNMSMRSIQNTIEKYFNTKISFRLIEKWIKSFKKMLNIDIEKERIKEKSKRIEILEMDELYTLNTMIQKKRTERIKIWTTINRKRNKVIAFELSKDSNRNDNIVCRRLLNKIKNNNNTIIINIIATDGNHSYNKVINKGYNNKDCNRHIISKSKTCLVECYNASPGGRFARFNRRTKSFSKSIISVYNTLLMWINRDILIENRRRYASLWN